MAKYYGTVNFSASATIEDVEAEDEDQAHDKMMDALPKYFEDRESGIICEVDMVDTVDDVTEQK